jgi:hypothetical protein
MQPDTDGGVLDDQECVDLSTYEETTLKYIQKKDAEDIEEMVKQMLELSKLYRKHAFDDDQTICRNYHQMILGLKDRIKELSGKVK